MLKTLIATLALVGAIGTASAAVNECPQPTAELDAAVCQPHVVKTVRVSPEEMPTAMLPTLPVMYTDGPFMSAFAPDEAEDNIGLVNDPVVSHERTSQG